MKRPLLNEDNAFLAKGIITAIRGRDSITKCSHGVSPSSKRVTKHIPLLEKREGRKHVLNQVGFAIKVAGGAPRRWDRSWPFPVSAVLDFRRLTSGSQCRTNLIRPGPLDSTATYSYYSS